MQQWKMFLSGTAILTVVVFLILWISVWSPYAFTKNPGYQGEYDNLIIIVLTASVSAYFIFLGFLLTDNQED